MRGEGDAEERPQAVDASGAPEKYQVFRAKHTLGMGAVTLLLSGPVQSPLPRPAKPEQRVSFLNPALEGATCYCSGMPVPSFAAVRCPGDTQAPTDQSSRSFTSLHTASIWIRGEKGHWSASQTKTQFTGGSRPVLAGPTELTACGSDRK